MKLWDVTPLSLGLELANGKMDAIIRANELIPVTKWRKGSQAFTAQRDGQESIRFLIYQGERPIAADNEFVGEVVLNLATTRPAGEVRVSRQNAQKISPRSNSFCGEFGNPCNRDIKIEMS